MTKEWEKLLQQEQKLYRQLEDSQRAHLKIQDLSRLFDDYDNYSSKTVDTNLYEAAYGSKYSEKFNEISMSMCQSRRKLLNGIWDSVEALNQKKRQIEDDIDIIYRAKRQESLK